MITTNNEQLINEAYSLIKYLYKTMPEYNKLKGTYTGIQLVLNLMGLCASITEIWSERTTNAIENFATDDGLHRADYLRCVKYRIDEWGKAEMKNYFLTSRFDLDIYQNNSMTFNEFANMSKTVILVMLQMAPVTRALHKLYYILKISNDLHIDYVFDSSVKHFNPNEIICKMFTYRYRWNITDNYFTYKSELDLANNNIYKVFLPWSTIKATLVNIKEIDYTGGETLYPSDNPVHEIETMKNSYFNLFNLDKKFNLSNQKTFKFSLIAKDNSTGTIYPQKIYSLEIGKYINITTEQNGIILEFLDEATSIFSDIFVTNIISETDSHQLVSEVQESELVTEDSIIFENSGNNNSFVSSNVSLWLTALFTMPLGTKYMYIDNTFTDNDYYFENNENLNPTINN